MSNDDDLIIGQPDEAGELTNEQLMEDPAVQVAVSLILYSYRLYYLARNTLVGAGVPSEVAAEITAAMVSKSVEEPVCIDEMIHVTEKLVTKYLTHVKGFADEEGNVKGASDTVSEEPGREGIHGGSADTGKGGSSII